MRRTCATNSDQHPGNPLQRNKNDPAKNSKLRFSFDFTYFFFRAGLRPFFQSFSRSFSTMFWVTHRSLSHVFRVADRSLSRSGISLSRSFSGRRPIRAWWNPAWPEAQRPQVRWSKAAYFSAVLAQGVRLPAAAFQLGSTAMLLAIPGISRDAALLFVKHCHGTLLAIRGFNSHCPYLL